MKKIEKAEDLRSVVAERYGEIAKSTGGCCIGCGCGSPSSTVELSRAIGYESASLATVPEDANLGLGCGNPTAIDSLQPGETVLDLGSGAGIDVFLAARQVGENGFVIGVDMTDEMLEKARANAAAGNYANVDFRKGLIEELPVDDASVDVIISNCVVNLSPEKDRVFRETRRVLKPGGRMMISDVVIEKPLPREVRENVDALVGCIANASLRTDYLEMIRNAGFTEIQIVSEANFGRHLDAEMPLLKDLAAETGVSQGIIEDCLDSVTSLSLLIR